MVDLQNPYAPPTADELPLPDVAVGGYQPSSGLALALRVLLGLTAGLVLVNAVVLFSQLDLLERAKGPGGIDLAEAEANDMRVALVSLAFLLGHLSTAVVWCIWQNRTSKNVRALGATGMEFGPNAWGWFFCPILNLWRPLSVMTELWASAPLLDRTAGQGKETWASSAAPGWLMMGWWLPWIVGNLISQVAQRMQTDDSDIGELITGTQFDIASCVSIAISGAFALVLVTMLQKRVEARRALVQTKGLL